MYSIFKNVRVLISLLKQHNIKNFVLSPGGTNIPIVQGIQDDPFFKCYSVVDERSAAYFAIGLYLQTGETVALCCTSAQATRNYLPGLTEAFYKNVPILAITTSKHERYMYQEYMQAQDITSMPNDAVKKTFTIPQIVTEDDYALSVRKINEAILELRHHNFGPVQLDLVMLDDQTRKFENVKLEKVRKIERYTLFEKEWNLNFEDKRVLLLIGEHSCFTKTEAELIELFCENFNVYVYKNHISNYHGKYSLNNNLGIVSMREEVFSKLYKPDILITIGGQTGDYSIYNKLSKFPSGSFEHWRVSLNGDIVDTYNNLTRVYESDIETFFRRVTNITTKKQTHEYFELWNNLYLNIKTEVEVPFSSIYAAQQLHAKLPNNSNLNLAILNSLRVWNFFDIDKSIVTHANVSAFGIDGCTSLFIGQSFATDNMCFLITGDLAYFYDVNAIGIRGIKNNVRILLINNGCGVEFKLAQNMSFDLDNYIAASGHYGRTEGWANDNDFKYISARNKDEFKKKYRAFVSASNKPIIFELFINPEDDVKAYEILLKCNLTYDKSFRNTIKEVAKNLLGSQIINHLK